MKNRGRSEGRDFLSPLGCGLAVLLYCCHFERGDADAQVGYGAEDVVAVFSGGTGGDDVVDQ